MHRIFKIILISLICFSLAGCALKETKYINGDDTGINSGIDATDPGSSENDGVPGALTGSRQACRGICAA
jgi:predicted small lipoprotein YifL